MVKKNRDDYMVSEHGNWNVAADYSKLKIMKPLFEADQYLIISEFGFVNFIEELSSNYSTDFLKIKGFKRLIRTLILVIDNSMFAIKKQARTDLQNYRKELERFCKIIPLLYSYKVDQRNKSRELVLNNIKFENSLDRVREIKSLILEPLNKYDLIFSHKEEFDPDKFKKELLTDLETIG